MNFRKLTLIFVLLFTFFFSAAFSSTVDVDHFLVAPSINGCGGFINNQSAYILENGRYSIGLHKFILKFNYGVFDIFEAGTSIDFGISSAFIEILKTLSFNAKAKILNEDKYFVSVAAGLEKLPVNIIQNINHEDYKLYAAVSKKLWDTDITLGVKKQLAVGNSSLSDWGFAANVSTVVADTVLVMLEYDKSTFNAGVKISFNQNLSVDFSIRGIEKISQAKEMGTFISNYFVFGITYLQ
ncbi:MAG: hypothetical protein WCJ94_00590 [bacterium]